MVNVQAYMGIVFFSLAVYCIGIVIYYAEPGFPWHSYITLVIGYFAAFGILLLVPIDIANCVTERRVGSIDAYNTYISNGNILSSAYYTFFTTILIFGSIVLVYEEYYNTDGYFTIVGKLISAFVRMSIDLVAMLVAALIVLAILIGQNVVTGTSALLLAAVIVTNGVYEFALMFFLAYGLVEFPRMLWSSGDLEYSLLSIQMKATSDYQEISDFKISIQEDISKVKYFKDQVGKLSSDQNLLVAVQVLEADCPNDFKSERKCKAEEVKAYLSKNGQVTLAGLAKLRQSLNQSKDKYKMAQAKVRTTERSAYILEDLVNAHRNKTGVIFWSLRNKESTKSEYQWNIIIKPRLYRFAAICTAMLSLFSFLGVVCSMAGVPNEASVYFLATHSASASGPAIVVFILFTLGYTTYVTLWSIFQIRVSGLVELVPFRTSPEFLSFNTRMCLRLAAPIAFFYLGWIAENGLKSGSWTQWVETTTFLHANSTAPTMTPIFSVNATSAPSMLPSILPTALPSMLPLLLGRNLTHSPATLATFGPSSLTSSTTFQMLSSFSQFYNIQAVAFVTSLYGTGFPIILFILVPLFALNFFNRLFVLLRMPYLQFGTPIATDEQLREGRRQLAKFKRIAERAEQRGILRGYLAAFSKNNADDSFDTEPSVTTAADARKGGKGGLLGRLFGSSSSPSPALNQAPVSTLIEPQPLNGEIERKMNVSRLTGSTWRGTYAQVAKPGILYFFKDAATAQSAFSRASLAGSDAQSVLEHEASDSYDLKDIKSFSASKKSESPMQLDLELSKETIRLRFRSAEETDRWRTLLQAWKDYAFDYALDSQGAISDDMSGFDAYDVESIRESLETNAASKRAVLAASESKRAADPYDLDSIVVEDDPALLGKKAGKGLFSGFGFGVKSSDSQVVKNENVNAADIMVDRPAGMEGFLEKKAKGKVSNEWQKKYFKIDEKSSTLFYYKSKNTSEKPDGEIDLRQIVSVGLNAKAGKDEFGRFDIDVGDRTYRLKAKSKTEAEGWVSALDSWRDYALLNME